MSTRRPRKHLDSTRVQNSLRANILNLVSSFDVCSSLFDTLYRRLCRYVIRAPYLNFSPTSLVFQRPSCSRMPSHVESRGRRRTTCSWSDCVETYPTGQTGVCQFFFSCFSMISRWIMRVLRHFQDYPPRSLPPTIMSQRFERFSPTSSNQSACLACGSASPPILSFQFSDISTHPCLPKFVSLCLPNFFFTSGLDSERKRAKRVMSIS